MNVREIVGHNIKHFRVTQGLTQERLAELLNISSSYIGYLERGKKNPSLDLLFKIATVLQIEPSILLRPLENDEKNQELKNLFAVLSMKNLGQIKFITEVTDAYFRSLDSINDLII